MYEDDEPILLDEEDALKFEIKAKTNSGVKNTKEDVSNFIEDVSTKRSCVNCVNFDQMTLQFKCHIQANLADVAMLFGTDAHKMLAEKCHKYEEPPTPLYEQKDPLVLLQGLVKLVKQNPQYLNTIVSEMVSIKKQLERVEKMCNQLVQQNSSGATCCEPKKPSVFSKFVQHLGL